MPRLIDDLRAPGARWQKPVFVPPFLEGKWAELAKKVRDILVCPDLPVLLIDNVAEYFYSCDQEYWDLKKDFPNLAPPYPTFWCEARMATHIHSKECGDTNIGALIPRGRIGVLISGVERSGLVGENIPDNLHWLLWCQLFIDFGRRDVVADGPHGSIFIGVDADGALVDRPWMDSLADDADARIMKHYMTFLNPALLAISFLHCRNVTIVENEVPAKLAKKYKARTGIKPTHYKTLVIEPLKQILRREGKSDQHGLPKALHICRGHFRDYREGRGLFGKYKQLVWTPSTIRGTRGEKAAPRELKIKI